MRRMTDTAEGEVLTDEHRGVESWYLLNLALWHKEYIA